MRKIIGLAACVGTILLTACASTIRRTGQIEMFEISDRGELQPLMSINNAGPERMPQRNLLKGDFGQAIRFNDDVVTLQVNSLYLEHLPWTLTGSTDVLLFAEVWESAPMGIKASALNMAVYVAENQRVPGRLNFDGNLAYGPTTFKGHPVRIKFTLIVLQKKRGQQASTAASVVSNFITAASVASPTAAVASQSIAMLRGILESQPDVVAFDFEKTFLSDGPEALKTIALNDLVAQKTSAESAKNALAQTDALGADGVSAMIASVASLPTASGAGDATIGGELNTSYSNLEATRIALATTQERLNSPIDFAQIGFNEYRATSADPNRNSNGSAYVMENAARRETEAERMMREAAEQSLSEQQARLAAAELKWKDNLGLAQQQVLARLLTIDGEMQKRWDEYVRTHPCERTSPWNAIMPWLRWGVYALVETEESTVVNGQRKRVLLPLGWQDQFRFDAGYLRSTNPASLGDSSRDRLRSNYLIFTLVPGQIAEDSEVLRAASKATDAYLNEIRQSDKSAQAAVEGATTLASSIARNVVVGKADEIGRNAATEAEGDADPIAKFADRFDAASAAFKTAINATGSSLVTSTQFDDIMATAKAKWQSRLTNLPPTTQTSSAEAVEPEAHPQSNPQ